MAIASLVIGIIAAVGVFCYGVPAVILGPVALFLGLRARTKIRASGGAIGGGGLAMAGWITGLVAACLGALILVVFIGFIVLVAVTGKSFPSPTPFH
jgi:hypothetical protein